MMAPVAVSPEKSAARAIHRTVGRYQDVLGFDVSVDFDSFVVGGLQAPTDLMSDVDGPLTREPALDFEYVVKAFG